MNYNVKGLNDLSKQFHEFQINAGFADSNITQRLMLVHSEISEAFEAYRKDKYARLTDFEALVSKSRIIQKDPSYVGTISPEFAWKTKFESCIKDSFEDELADVIIRLLALCAENNIDIERHIQLKMKYNELRGFKYGGKKF